MPANRWYEGEVAKLPDLSGKVMAITGTTSGTGFAAAKTMAAKGARVLLLNRKSSRSDESLKRLQEIVPDGDFEQVECDLQSFDSVRAAAEAVKAVTNKLHVLCCNAGVMALADERTKDGYDVQAQTNVLSHFLLTKELFPLLVATEGADGEARVVTHSSGARLMMSKLQTKYFEKCPPGTLGGDGTGLVFGNRGRWLRYAQTKMANCSQVWALGDRCEAAGLNIKCATAHPGYSNTQLQGTTKEDGGWSWTMKLAEWFVPQQSPDDGALGIIQAMASDSVKPKDFFGPGSYGSVGRAVSLEHDNGLDSAPAKNLVWKVCEEACGAFVVSKL